MAALIKIFKKEAPEYGNADITGYGAKSFKQFLMRPKKIIPKKSSMSFKAITRMNYNKM